jgi:hypothetical protein
VNDSARSSHSSSSPSSAERATTSRARAPVGVGLEHPHDFPALVPSAIERVIQALEARGLVERDGDPERVYLGGVTFRPRSRETG